jgi:hypothetical protein
MPAFFFHSKFSLNVLAEAQHVAVAVFELDLAGVEKVSSGPRMTLAPLD